MSKIITEAQKHEIESLSVEHWDALIAYGADMYRDGLIRGAIIGVAGAALGVTISVIVKEVKKHRRTTVEKKALKDSIQSFVKCDFDKVDLRIHKTKEDQG